MVGFFVCLFLFFLRFNRVWTGFLPRLVPRWVEFDRVLPSYNGLVLGLSGSVELLGFRWVRTGFYRSGLSLIGFVLVLLSLAGFKLGLPGSVEFHRVSMRLDRVLPGLVEFHRVSMRLGRVLPGLVSF